ncbi:adenylate-forming enzyme AfeA [Trichoderma chlorosporum]
METQTFPHDPILVKLLTAFKQISAPEPVIHDVMGFEKSYSELLADILRTRSEILQTLPSSGLSNQNLLHDEYPYIFLLSNSGYEFLVGFFAIRALGGAPVPLASGILPEEAHIILSKTKANCILFGKNCTEKAADICNFVKTSGNPSLLAPCPISSNTEPQTSMDLKIDDSTPLDPSGPGIVLFTSGTTGPPKAAVLPRRSLTLEYPVTPGSAGANWRAGHWIGGADSLIRPILAGQTLYCVGWNAAVKDILQAFTDHQITFALFNPTLLRQMRDLIAGETGILTEEVKNNYCTLFRGLSTIMCGGNGIEESVRQFWFDLTGLPFENFYASTEMGTIAIESISEPVGCIGTPVPGVEVKLSSGVVGEIRIKSPTMLTHYIGDEEKTQAAFDEDGYLKTGDIAEFKNGKYFILGRQNIDYVGFLHFQIPTLKVEQALMKLPYISNACVLGIPYPRTTQLCGAAVHLRPDMPAESISLKSIRFALRDFLPAYMQPFVLRIMKEDEVLHCTPSGKFLKKKILADYFGGGGWDSANKQPPGVELWDSIPSVENWGRTPGMEGTHKAWDWGGLQHADQSA